MAAPTSIAPLQNPLPTESRPHRVDKSRPIVVTRTPGVGSKPVVPDRPIERQEGGGNRPLANPRADGEVAPRAVVPTPDKDEVGLYIMR